jgi:hypothetical protein
MPRIGKAYACSRWPIDWAVGFIGLGNVEKGLANSYGQKNLSYSIVYPGSSWGEVALVYTSVTEVYQDLIDYLLGKLSDGGEVETELTLASVNSAQEVTNTSPDSVFQGSNNRS